ncbi:MAG: nitroreductase family protein [Micrococcales bacterium]|nr:nitroreductase family protein [Micrococcales bacterium]
MDFDEVVRRRRMVRAFDAAPVPVEALRRALHRAVRAPSAGFTQGWDFVVLTSGVDRERFWAAATPDADGASPDRWLRGVRAAPCLVVVCSDPQAYLERYSRPDKRERAPGVGARDWPVPYWDVDAGMAALLLLLSGVDDGLGGLFFGVPGQRTAHVAASLGVPQGRRLVGVVALGYPALAAGSPAVPQAEVTTSAGRHRPARRALADVVHEGRFGTTAQWLDEPLERPSPCAEG